MDVTAWVSALATKPPSNILGVPRMLIPIAHPGSNPRCCILKYLIFFHIFTPLLVGWSQSRQHPPELKSHLPVTTQAHIIKMQSSLEMQAQQPNPSCKQNCKSTPVIHLMFGKMFFMIPSRASLELWFHADWGLSSPVRMAAAWRLLLISTWKPDELRRCSRCTKVCKRGAGATGVARKMMEVDTYLQIWLMFLLLWIAMQRDFLLWKQHS